VLLTKRPGPAFLHNHRVASIGTWFFQRDASQTTLKRRSAIRILSGAFIAPMLDQGIWLPPSQFEAAFLSTAHGTAEVQATITAARHAFESMAE